MVQLCVYSIKSGNSCARGLIGFKINHRVRIRALLINLARGTWRIHAVPRSTLARLVLHSCPAKRPRSIAERDYPDQPID